MLQKLLRLANPEIVLGFLIASVLWIGVLGWQAAYAPTETEKRQCEETATKTGHKTEECKTLWEKTTTDPVAFFTFWLVVFTGVLGASTVLLWRSGERQAELTQAALIGDQRAWVMVSLELEGFRFGPIVDGAADVDADLIFQVRNVGRTPALNAALRFELIGNFSSPAIVIREFAEINNTASQFDGRLVSPGEEYTVELTASAPRFRTLSVRASWLGNAAGELDASHIKSCRTGKSIKPRSLTALNDGRKNSRIFIDAGDLDVNDLITSIAPGGFIT